MPTVGNGEAKITAKAGDKTATCKVLVSTLASGVTLDKTELTLKIEDSPVTLVAKVTPASTSDKTVTWRSSNEKVATVDSNGRARQRSPPRQTAIPPPAP